MTQMVSGTAIAGKIQKWFDTVSEDDGLAVSKNGVPKTPCVRC